MESDRFQLVRLTGAKLGRFSTAAAKPPLLSASKKHGGISKTLGPTKSPAPAAGGPGTYASALLCLDASCARRRSYTAPMRGPPPPPPLARISAHASPPPPPRAPAGERARGRVSEGGVEGVRGQGSRFVPSRAATAMGPRQRGVRARGLRGMDAERKTKFSGWSERV